MATKEILVYHTREIVRPPNHTDVRFNRWVPSLNHPIPSKKPWKYIIYTVFSLLRIFKNKNYSHYYLLDSESIASSLLTIPAYFQWPFMQSNSVQFTYVMTAEEHRGKGLAWKGIYDAYRDLKNNGIKDFWYVTDNENIASQKLAKKMGFNFVGSAKKRRSTLAIIKKLELDEVD